MNRFQKLYEDNVTGRGKSPELDKIFQIIEEGKFSNAERKLGKGWGINKRIEVVLEGNTGIMISNPSPENLTKWKKHLTVNNNCLLKNVK